MANILPPNGPSNSTDTPLVVLVREFRGVRSEVRITRAEYEGRRFTKLHVWDSGPHGTFPTRKLVTIRDRELGEVIAALEASRAAAVEEQRRAGDATNPHDTGARAPAAANDAPPPAWLTKFHQKNDRRRG